jgi:iron complex transport system ATP-binding protein
MIDRSLVNCANGKEPPAVVFESVRIWSPQGVDILRDIGWRVRRGERWALLGPNGSGKSTMLSLAGALRHPSRGKVTVLSGTLGRVDMPKLRRSIGHVDSSSAPLAWLTAEETVLTGIGATIRPIWANYTDDLRMRARELLALLGCADLANREIGTCSQGERGRIRIARALIANPELLLLDEPAVGLDLAAREALIAALDRLSGERPELTSILVTHHLEELPASTTHALLLREGSAVASGPILQVLNSENLSQCFGIDIECRHDGERWSARAPANWARMTSMPNEDLQLALEPA